MKCPTLLLSAMLALTNLPLLGQSEMAPAHSLIEAERQHDTSGTSIEPPSSPAPMLMRSEGNWTLMMHGNAFVADTQQAAEHSRGGDKLFSTNWVMPMAQRSLSGGTLLTLRAMLSLEPATITGRLYPELFQQGETAYGRPIVDGQHPHDFFMEVAALVDVPLGENTMLSLYAAPIGDPAIGPTAYPHRLSASEDPIATLGHHQEDSTHIAFNVLTAGLSYRMFRIEGSGFHGAEPTEARWQPEPSPNGHAVDSYATRLTFVPRSNIAAQYSIAHLTSPEAVAPGVNQRRQTASVMFNLPVGVRHDTTSMPGMDMASAPRGNWSTTLLWGQARSRTLENSYLLESLLRLGCNSFYTRIESAARTSELLQPAPPEERGVGHVQAYTAGYDREYRLAPHLVFAPGAQFTLYHAPHALAPAYGRYPVGGVAFVRIRITE